MKIPQWLHRELAKQRRRVRQGTTTRAEAVNDLREQIDARDAGLADEIVAEWLEQRLPALPAAPALPGDGQGELDLFPGLGLPRKLEVSPNRFKFLGEMTRADWLAARRQARTKANNATGYADLLDEAYDRVEHLLTDDELTTAQVLAA